MPFIFKAITFSVNSKMKAVVKFSRIFVDTVSWEGGRGRGRGRGRRPREYRVGKIGRNTNSFEERREL